MAEYVAQVDAEGRVDIPWEVKNELEIEAGDNLIFRFKEGRLEVEKLSMSSADYGESLSMVGIIEV